MPGMYPGDQGDPGGDPGDLGESRYRIRVGQVHGHRDAVRARAAQSLGEPGDLVALDVGEHQPAWVRSGESLAHGKAYAFRGSDDHAHVMAHRQAPMLRPPSTVTTEPVT